MRPVCRGGGLHVISDTGCRWLTSLSPCGHAVLNSLKVENGSSLARNSGSSGFPAGMMADSIVSQLLFRQRSLDAVRLPPIHQCRGASAFRQMSEGSSNLLALWEGHDGGWRGHHSGLGDIAPRAIGIGRGLVPWNAYAWGCSPPLGGLSCREWRHARGFSGIYCYTQGKSRNKTKTTRHDRAYDVDENCIHRL